MNNCSIIIPHYNGETILLRCLKSLFQYTPNHHEIIIVDNASSDNSIEIIKNQFPQIKLILNKTTDSKDIIKFQNSIELKDVSFTYPTNKNAGIFNVNIKIPHGSKVGI